MSFEIRSSGNQNVTSSYGFPLNTNPQGVPDDVRNIVQEILALLKAVVRDGATSGSSNDPSASATPGSAAPLSQDSAQAQPLAASSSTDDTTDGSGTSADPQNTTASVTPDAPSPSTDQTTTQPSADADADADTQDTEPEKNADDVAQARTINGVDLKSSQVLQTGTGSDKTFNYTNNTDRTQSVTYSVQGDNKVTMTLKPGATGSFVAGSGDLGVRISPSDAHGNMLPNEVLYEDGGGANGRRAGASPPTGSEADGDKRCDGNASDMTVTLSDRRTAGNGDAIRAYLNATDDTVAVGLAGDASKTVNIVQSDA